MNKTTFVVFVLILFLTSCLKEDRIMPPVAKKIKKELITHGHERVDNYYWLNERENPEVIAYLEAENSYTEAVLKKTEPLQEKLFEEIKSKIKQEDESVPYKKNGYYYYTRTVPEMEYYLLCRKKETLDNAEEVMLDLNKMAKGHEYYALGGSSVSPDNKLLAFGVDTISRRKYTLRIKDLDSGELLKDKIPLTTGRAVWANDNKTIYYVLKDDITLRSMKIMKHTIGSPFEDDQLVYYEEDETFSVFIYKTKSQDYLIIGSESTLTSEYRYLDANDPDGDFTVIQPRTRGLEYNVEHFEDNFYIRTNLDALNFRLMKTPVSSTSRENWKEVIPHRGDVYLSDFSILKEYLVVTERKEGISQIRVLPWRGEEYTLPFKEEVYTVRPDVNLDFDTEFYRFSYTSMTTPRSVFSFNLKTRERELLKQTEILGGFSKENYESRRVYATAGDGTKIPISMVYRKGMERTGDSPTVLYGYGSYGSTIDPGFNLSILPLLDRGFIYAIAHIRGGQINGRSWYEDGKLLKKMNTFTDFNDCAQYFVNENYTNPNKLFAKGGSAGGLLMGACMNMRPDLYKGVIAHVPFVDVVTTMLDESIPLTTSEFDEWGNPKNEMYYHYMRAYSPYDNVAPKDYPALFVTTGLHDSQVQYWEPAKWVAKLRELKTDNNLLIFHINMDYGHGGASGRFQWIKDTALEFAFIFNELNLE